MIRCQIKCLFLTSNSVFSAPLTINEKKTKQAGKTKLLQQCFCDWVTTWCFNKVLMWDCMATLPSADMEEYYSNRDFREIPPAFCIFCRTKSFSNSWFISSIKMSFIQESSARTVSIISSGNLVPKIVFTMEAALHLKFIPCSTSVTTFLSLQCRRQKQKDCWQGHNSSFLTHWVQGVESFMFIHEVFQISSFKQQTSKNRQNA